MKRKIYLTLITTLLLSVIHLTTQAQNRTLKGRVLDDKGSPIPGAAIRIKNNPTVGTVTSAEGVFSLSVPSSADSLRITALSFKEQIVAISDDLEIRRSSPNTNGRSSGGGLWYPKKG